MNWVLSTYAFVAVALGAMGIPAYGDVVTLDTGSGYQNGGLYITLAGVFDSPTSNAGGDIGLPPNNGSIDGVPVPFLYCLDIVKEIIVPSSDEATLSDAGIVDGNLLNGAAQIAWLVDNIALAATDLSDPQAAHDAQLGLQAAIWQQIYGSNFALVPYDPNNSNTSSQGVTNAYNADIAALAGQSAPLNHAIWISTFSGDPSSPIWLQPLVTASSLSTPSASTVPEASTFVVWSLLGAVGVVVARRRQAV
jgi:hypothetical protein